MQIVRQDSPNWDERADGKAVQYVILHYTGMESADAARHRLCDPAAKASSHYMIERDGKIWQFVGEDKRAWHAGQSFWRGERDMNGVSVGIELVNRGHQFGYETFPDAQIGVCGDLILDIMHRHAVPASNIIGHSDIAPMRKEDPGEYFPWKALAARGIGLWGEPAAEHEGAMDIAEIRRSLRQIGYECPEAGEYDRELRLCLLAFQRHWHQDNLTGLPNAGTAARLRLYRALYSAIIGSK
ncbi:MAG: N-acetylmuramoyl-L-alanine amidase [Alphaproteobacteria bacterium]